MQIHDIKQQLSLLDLAESYQIKLNKHSMTHCFWHEDKTPSLQIKAQYFKCFGCGKGGDLIQFVEDYKKVSTAEAVKICKSLLGKSDYKPMPLVKKKEISIDYDLIFKSLRPKVGQSSKAKQYLKSRLLSPSKLELGYNSGSGFDKLKCCLVFPLKDSKGKVVSLYGRSIIPAQSAQSPKHFYTAYRKGLYPHYPDKQKDKLIITEAIIDAATLLQFDDITSNYEILSAYGVNGFTSEHLNAVNLWMAPSKSLNKARELIFFFDGDAAGNQAVNRLFESFKTTKHLNLAKVDTPEGEDVNSLLQGHDQGIFTHLLESRQILKKTSIVEELHTESPIETSISEAVTKGTFNHSKGRAVYTFESLKIEALGKLDTKNLGELKMTFVVHNTENQSIPFRQNINLYHQDQLDKTLRKIVEKTGLRLFALEKGFNEMTTHLENKRLETLEDKKQKTPKLRYPLRVLSYKEEQEAISMLKSKALAQSLSHYLQQTGIVGEQSNAVFLFLILLSHQMPKPLHGMVQGTSGSGKSHLIKKVADCMYDQNKIKRFTRVTDKSFYNYGEYDLRHCGIILEDYDGLTMEAELAWRELQSNDKLISSVSQKNEQTGEISTGEKYVFGPIASLVATTQFNIYEDNESRVFIIAIDESAEQTERVLEYMAKKASKITTSEHEKSYQYKLQNMTHLLKPYAVKNPYRLELPQTVKHRRRLTQMLHDFVEQVTILHQYQRQRERSSNNKETSKEVLIADLEDLEIAVKLMFDSIIIKADELDGILRQFYENLKAYIEEKGKDYAFSQREIRQVFKLSKTQCFRYFSQLQQLEYIHRTQKNGGNAFYFQISYWDNIVKLREDTKAFLLNQIEQYRQGNALER